MRIIILLLAFQLASAVTFDLDQCLDFAEKNNKSIEISNYQKDISGMNVKDARNRFYQCHGTKMLTTQEFRNNRACLF